LRLIQLRGVRSSEFSSFGLVPSFVFCHNSKKPSRFLHAAFRQVSSYRRHETSKVFTYNYIGIQHNKGLNYVLDKIQNASIIKQKRSKAELLKFTKEKVKEYLVNNNIDTSVVNLVYNNSTFFKNIGRLYKITDLTSIFNGLSEGQKTFANKILSLTEAYNNLENLGNSLNLLDQQALTVLGKKDSKIILMAASIAYNSVEYWRNNYNK